MIHKSTCQNQNQNKIKSLLLTLVAILLCTTGFAQWNTWCYKDYTSNGSFTPPAGCDEMYIEAIGGGGGGGSAHDPGTGLRTSVGSGGGGGGYARKHVSNPGVGTQFTITIGYGGGAAAAGGNTTVTGGGVNISANGGGGGTSNLDFSNSNNSGNGGTATGGDFNYTGGRGGRVCDNRDLATGLNHDRVGSGCGGGAAGGDGNGGYEDQPRGGNTNAVTTNGYGGGGTATGIPGIANWLTGGAGGNGRDRNGGWNNGNPGNNYGGGGGGARTNGSNGAKTGGSGAAGMVRVWFHISKPITLTASANPTTVCPSRSATLTASASNTLGSVSYAWNNGAGNGSQVTVSPSSTTTYTVTLTDTYQTGCSVTKTANVTVTVANPSLTLGNIESKTICQGGSTTLTVPVTAHTGNLSYAWSSGLGSNATSGNISAAGDYTVTVTASIGDCSVTKTATGHVTVNNPQITLNDLEGKTICDGGSTTLTASVASSNGTVTYAWSNSLGNNATSGSITASGTYTVTATATFGSCTKTDTKSATVSIYPTFSAGAIATAGQQRCQGSGSNSGIGSTTAAAGGDGSISYQWQLNGADIAGATNATYTPTQTEPGTYTFTRKAKDGSCADWTSSTGSYTLTIYALPTLDEPSNRTQTVCAGNAIEDITFTYTNATSIQVSGLPAGLSLSGNKITGTPTASGTYTVTTVNENGCTEVSRQGTITVNELPTLTVTPTNVTCNGKDNGKLAVAVSGGTPSYTIYNNSTSVGTLAAAGTYNIENLEPGNYTVSVTDNNGCSATADSKTITQPQPLTVTIDSHTDVSCYGGNDATFTITISGGTPLSNGKYLVSVDRRYYSGGSLQDNLSAGTHTVSSPWGFPAGEYEIYISDGNGCYSPKQYVTVTQPTELKATITAQTDVLCKGAETGSVTVTATEGTGTAPYQYKIGSGSYQDNGTFSNLAAGTYTVTVKDAHGCTKDVPVTITEPESLPTVTVNNANICLGQQSATLTATVSSDITEYLWSNGETTQSITVAPSTATSYKVTVTNGNGCTAEATGTVGIYAVPQVSITPIANELCPNIGTKELTATITSATVAPYTYTWSGDLTVSDAAINGTTISGTATIPTDCNANYTVQMDVTDANGCTAQATTTITVKDATKPTIGHNIPGSVIDAVPAANCTYTVPDLTGRVNGTDGCSNTFTKTQEPAAGTTIAASQWVTVAVIDECNNSNSTNIYVIVPETLALTENTHTNINCYNGSDGSITVNTATGGTAPYTYAIDGGTAGEGKTFSGLAAGEHTITVYDNNGCSKDLKVTLTQPAQLTLTLTPTKETCTGHDGKIETTVNGGTTPYSYTWSNGHNAASCDTLTSLANGGVYTVTVKDAHNCSVEKQATVELDNPLAMEPITGPTVCTGTEFTITPPTDEITLPSDTKYEWPAPDTSAYPSIQGGLASGTNQPNINGRITLVEGATAPVTIEYDVTPILGVCRGIPSDVSVTVSATINPNVTITIDRELTKCANAADFPIEATFVNSNSAATVVWKLGDETVATHNLSATTHTDSYTVNLPNDVCKGQYNYHVYYTDESGCTANDACVITVNAGEWSIDNTTYPNGSADVECVSAATDPSSFAPTGAQIIDGCDRATTRTLYSTVTSPNPIVCEGTVTYTYRYTACDDTYQDWTYTYSVKDNTVPAFADDILTTKPADIDQTKCEFSIPDLTADVRAKVSDNCTAAADLVITQNPAAGTVITAATDVVVTVKDKCEKQNTHTVNVTVPTLPTVILSAGVADCNGSATGSASVTASNGTPGYTYLWSNGKTTAAITDLTAGEYSVTVTDANGCKVNDQIEVTEPNKLEVAIAATDNKTAICYGGNIDLTATAEGGNGTYTYAWTNSTETDNSINVAPTATTTYTVTVTDAKNCTATGNFLLTVNSLPVISISDVDPLCPTIGTTELTASLTTTSATPYRYAWTGDLTVTPATTPAAPVSIPDPSDEQILNAPAGTSETSNTVTATIPTTCGTNYAVSVTVTDANGCTATDNATVSVKTPAKPVIEVAKNSNPDGDCNPEIIAPTFNVIDECNASAVATVTTTGVQGDSYEKTQTWTATYTNICGNKADTVKVTYNWIEDHVAPTFKPGKSWTFPHKQNLDICLSDCPAFPTKEEVAALFEDENSGAILPEQVEVRYDTTSTQCRWYVWAYYTIIDACGNATEEYQLIYDGNDQSAPELIHEWPADITGIDACKAAGTENYEEVYDLLDAHFDIQPNVDSYFEDCAAITVGDHFDSITGDDCEWKITRFFPIEDACRNKDTLKIEVSGGDHTKPTFTAPANTTIYCKSSCSFDANVGKTGDVTNEWDNCSTDIQANYADNDLSRDECGGWILNRKWSLEDNCHNKAEDQIQVITILDTVAPVLAEGQAWPENISNHNSCYAARPDFPTNAEIAALFYDSCSQDILEANVSYEDKNITESNCGWSITREYTIKDKCNNATVKSITYSGSDRTAPVRNADPWPSNITGKNSCLADADISGLKSDEDIASLYTDCGKVTVTHNDVSTGNDCEWTITRTYTVKDTCNNQVTPSPTMSVSGGDHIKPTFTAPADIVIEREPNCGFDVTPSVTGDVTDEADNCSTGLVAYYSSLEDVLYYDESTYNTTITRTWHLEDNCGNKAADQVQVITIIDVTAPELEGTWPSDITNQDNCLANAVTTGLKSDAAIHDLFFDCSLPITVTHKDDTTSTDCSWTITRTYTIKDVVGNTVTPAPTMSVSGGDLTAPVLKQNAVWPSNIANHNSCYAGRPAFPTNAEIAALFTDACSGDLVEANVSYEDKDMTDYNCGWTITREYTIEDACGNAVSPKPTITYSGKDLDAPSLTVPGSWPSNITDQDNCLANADKSGLKSNEDIKYLFSDCGPIVVTSKDDTTGNNCAWTITRTYTIADMCGNTYKTWGDVLPTMSVSGGDKTAPVLAEGKSWPENSTNNDCCYSARPAFPTNADIAALFTDACSGAVLTANVTYTENEVKTSNCDWEVVRTYTIKDTCGNIYSKDNLPTITISGGDKTAPVLAEGKNWPSDKENVNSCYANRPDFPTNADIAALFTDVCSGDVLATNVSYEENEVKTSDCDWEVVRTYTIKDTCGNIYKVSDALPTITYSGGDKTVPSLTCEESVTKTTDFGMPFATVNFDDPTYGDNCSANYTITYAPNTPSGASVTNASGQYPIGTTTVTYLVTDACNNKTQCFFTVTVGDNQAPAITCPGTITVACIDEVPTAYANYAAFVTADGIATDNDAIVESTFAWVSDESDHNSCPETITRTYTIKDASGNASTCEQLIVVKDSIKPTFTRPADITIYKDASCNYSVAVAVTGDVTDEADNCSTGIEATYEDEDVTPDDACQGKVVIKRTWSLVDNCGNAAENQVQTITVEDNTAPTFTRPADITIYKDASCDYSVAVAVTGDVTDEADNCSTGIEATYEDEDVTPDDACQGKVVIKRTWSLVDNCGNAAADQVQTITVEDNTAPTFTRPADITIYKDASCNYSVAVAVTGDVTDEADNCSTGIEATYEDEDVTPDDACQGKVVIKRTWSLVDNCGNAAADQVQTITVEDNTAPTFTRPADITICRVVPTGEIDANTALTGEPTAQADNCTDAAALITTVQDLDTLPANDNVTRIIRREWKVTDDCGNYSTQIQEISVLPAMLPSNTTLTCPADIDITMAYNACDTMLNIGMATYETQISGVSIDLTNNAPANNRYPEGTTVVTWKLTDTCGFTITCDQTIIVRYPVCEPVTDVDGITYDAVRIGCQCWTASNLRSSHYSDGTAINNYSDYGKNPDNDEVYGKLYSWYSAVNVPEGDNATAPATDNAFFGPYIQGVCPDGWALPSDVDYQTLFNTAATTEKLKEADSQYWLPGTAGVAPTTGFDARGAGYYDAGIDRYLNLMGETYYWTSEPTFNYIQGHCAVINYYCPDGLIQSQDKGRGQSVRCLRMK